ncbi:MAG: tRNA (N6-isopentenyl adenosine(37)-C2)-methylthiotransferase MiaB [Candidatus Eisenbacteria bacterium]|nr:tRNA (N6-isopentenyl adenosine(37)-C2)-methylthiotransferase MiaB [Candidatus Eisenbacteria bacterium]
MRYYVETYGCQMNVYDSKKIEEVLTAEGLSRAARPEEADVIIVNTCSVREHAENRALTRIGELSLKAAPRKAVVAVCGCMAQRMGSELFKNRAVRLVLGPDSYSKLAGYLRAAVTDGAKLLDTARDRSFRFQASEGFRDWGLRGFVSITKGCSNSCSYCIVPAVRGPAVSRPRDEVLKETLAQWRSGVRDVTLIGQNVNAYRYGGTGFSTLLSDVAELVPEARVRFTTSHPRDMDDSVIGVMAVRPNVCEHIHLPLQSGSDRVLESMNRGYTRDRYRAIVSAARKAMPGVSITTDIIVGYPGESVEEYEETYSFFEEMQFDSAFMFKFSARPGTAASRMSDEVPRQEKERRLARLMELERRLASAASARLVGREMEVLVEGRKIKDGVELLTGRTRCNRTVLFRGASELSGKLVSVRIDSSKGVSLSGCLVSA